MHFVRLLATVLVGVVLCPQRILADDIVRDARKGNVAKVKALIDQNPSLVRGELEDYRRSGERLIHLAVFDNQMEKVALLLERSADIDAKSDIGTPLQMAVRFGYKDLAEFLLKKGARLDIHSAAGLGKINHVRRMLRVNPRLARSTNSPYKMTPLHWVSFSGNVEVAKLLLARWANPSAFNSSAWTPLRLAVLFDRHEIATLLLAHKAKVDSRDDDGDTPLCLAVRLRRVKIARILIDAGADVNAREGEARRRYLRDFEDPRQDTPLPLAIANHDHIASALVISRRGTILHIAARLRDRDLIKLLVLKKADVKAREIDDTGKEYSGATPIERLCELELDPSFEEKWLGIWLIRLDQTIELIDSLLHRAK